LLDHPSGTFPRATCNILSASVNRMEAAAKVNWNDDRIDRFAEQVDHRFERVDERFDTVDRRLERLETQVDERFERFEAQVDKRFDKVDARFEHLHERLEKRFDLLTYAMIVTLAGFLAAFASTHL
jgi:hypothetical protein